MLFPGGISCVLLSEGLLVSPGSSPRTSHPNFIFWASLCVAALTFLELSSSSCWRVSPQPWLFLAPRFTQVSKPRKLQCLLLLLLPTGCSGCW